MKLLDPLHAFLWNSNSANNCNTYLIRGSGNILVDPGHAAHFDHVKKGLEELGLALSDIGLVVITHAHPDHIEAIQFFKNEPALVAFHEEEWKLAQEMAPYLQSMLGLSLEDFSPDLFLQEGEFSFQDMSFQILHTPGHSPGSISLYWAENRCLFTGDVIFQDGLGRTDLPGGNGSQLKESIRRLSALDADFLLSGHGPVISDKTSVQENFAQVETAWFRYI